MSLRAGRSVRLFLADGTASGIKTAEIMNWTGHVLAGPRSSLPAFLKRSELNRTGVYLLTGHDPADPDTPQVYIGESDNVRSRLVLHNNDHGKDFWERTCVVTSKDQNFTKAHARYIEARLISIAISAGTASVVNGTTPPLVSLPEADISDMEFFVDQIQMILPVLGFDLLRQPTVKETASEQFTQTSANHVPSPLFRLTSKKYGIEATAREIDGDFVVLKGSSAVADWRGQKGVGYEKQHGYEKQRRRLIESRKLVFHSDGCLRFSEDVAFRSPSGASTVILGRMDNGRTSWKVDDLKLNYGEWQSAQADKASVETLRAQDDDEAKE